MEKEPFFTFVSKQFLSDYAVIQRTHQCQKYFDKVDLNNNGDYLNFLKQGYVDSLNVKQESILNYFFTGSFQILGLNKLANPRKGWPFQYLLTKKLAFWRPFWPCTTTPSTTTAFILTKRPLKKSTRHWKILFTVIKKLLVAKKQQNLLWKILWILTFLWQRNPLTSLGVILVFWWQT